MQHAADRADGVNAGGLRRAGQAAADRPHGDVGFVGNFLVSHFPSLLIADLLDLQNPAPFLPDSAGERLNAAENGGIMYCQIIPSAVRFICEREKIDEVKT